MRVAFSGEGLDWVPSPKNPVGPYLEWCGSRKRGRLFFVTGQMGPINEPAPGNVRRLHTLSSADFETWSSCPAMGLNRGAVHAGPHWESQRNLWDEVHLDAGLWERGNVVLAFYGM